MVEFGRTIGAQILVPKAGCDLEIAIEPGDHQQLLEHLRRLGKRVESPRMQAAGHQIVARAFGAGSAEDRGLEFAETLIGHPAAQALDHLIAEHDVAMHPLAPQIDEAVFEADILGIFLLARDRQRQFVGAALHDGGAGEDLDLAGRQIGIDRPFAARLDLAVDRHDAFELQPVEQLQRVAILIGDDLGDAVMIAQIDEQHAAMIALLVDPARKADGLADILLAERGAIVGTIGVHRDSFHFGR